MPGEEIYSLRNFLYQHYGFDDADKDGRIKPGEKGHDRHIKEMDKPDAKTGKPDGEISTKEIWDHFLLEAESSPAAQQLRKKLESEMQKIPGLEDIFQLSEKYLKAAFPGKTMAEIKELPVEQRMKGIYAYIDHEVPRRDLYLKVRAEVKKGHFQPAEVFNDTITEDELRSALGEDMFRSEWFQELVPRIFEDRPAGAGDFTFKADADDVLGAELSSTSEPGKQHLLTKLVQLSRRGFAMCSEYAQLFMAMGRQAGLDVRYAVAGLLKKNDHALAIVTEPGSTRRWAIDLANPQYGIQDLAVSEKKGTYKNVDIVNDIEALSFHHYNEANLYQDCGMFAEAEKSYLISLKIFSENVYAYERLGDLYVEWSKLPGGTERGRQAEECFKQAIHLFPHKSYAYVKLAELYLTNMEEAQSSKEKAAEYRKKAVEKLAIAEKENPENAHIYTALGRLAFIEGKLTKARDLYLKALQTEPEDEVIWQKLWDFYESLVKVDPNLEHCAALERMGYPGWAEHYKAMVFLIKGDPAGAIASFQKALAANAGDAYWQAMDNKNLGWCYFAQGDLAAAAESFWRACTYYQRTGELAKERDLLEVLAEKVLPDLKDPDLRAKVSARLKEIGPR